MGSAVNDSAPDPLAPVLLLVYLEETSCKLINVCRAVSRVDGTLVLLLHLVRVATFMTCLSDCALETNQDSTPTQPLFRAFPRGAP